MRTAQNSFFDEFRGVRRQCELSGDFVDLINRTIAADFITESAYLLDLTVVKFSTFFLEIFQLLNLARHLLLHVVTLLLLPKLLTLYRISFL